MPASDSPSPRRSAAEEAADDAAYVELSRNLRGLALRLVRQEATADDIVQEAWLAALDEPPERIRNLNSWLRRVVHNVAARRNRRSKRLRDLESAVATPEAVAAPDAPSMRESHATLLRESVATLPEPYRTVLTRRFLEERTVAQVASELGHSPATVRSQVKRGLVQLRQILDRKQGGRRDAWLPGLALLAREQVEGASRASAPSAGAWLAPALVAVSGLVGWLALRSPDPEPADRPRAALLAVAGPPERPSEEALLGDSPPPVANREAVALSSPATMPEEDRVAVPAADSTRELEVRVRRADGSTPRDARVRVWGKEMSDLGTYETDGEGRVTITVSTADLMQPPLVASPHGGVYVAAGEREEAWSFQYNVGLPPSKTPRRTEVRTRGPAQELRITVRAEDGDPIPRASVLIDGSTGGMFGADGDPIEERMSMQTCDERGLLVLNGMSRRLYRLIVSAPEFVSSDRTYQQAGPVLEATVVLARGSVVYGQVLGPGGAVGDARVWEQTWLRAQLLGEQHEAWTDENGFFEHAGFGPGRHRLFARSASDPTLFACEVLDVLAGEDVAWNLTLARPGPTVVRVLDGRGDPFEGAEVSLNNGDGKLPWVSGILATGRDGLASFSHCPPGDLRALVSRSANERTVLEELVLAGQELVVRLEPEVAPGGLAGVVLEADGSPSERATVFGVHRRETFDVPVDSTTGSFRSVGLSAGEYRLSVVTENGVHGLGAYEAPPGGSHQIEVLHLPAPTPVSLEWLDIAPSPEDPWTVEHSVNWQQRPLTIRALEEAHTSLQLFEGSYRIRPIDASHPGVVFTVHAEALAPVRIESR